MCCSLTWTTTSSDNEALVLHSAIPNLYSCSSQLPFIDYTIVSKRNITSKHTEEENRKYWSNLTVGNRILCFVEFVTSAKQLYICITQSNGSDSIFVLPHTLNPFPLKGSPLTSDLSYSKMTDQGKKSVCACVFVCRWLREGENSFGRLDLLLHPSGPIWHSLWTEPWERSGTLLWEKL